VLASFDYKIRCLSSIDQKFDYFHFFAERGGRPRFLFGGGTSSTVFGVVTGFFLATFAGGAISHGGLIYRMKRRDNYVTKSIKQ